LQFASDKSRRKDSEGVATTDEVAAEEEAAPQLTVAKSQDKDRETFIADTKKWF